MFWLGVVEGFGLCGCVWVASTGVMLWGAGIGFPPAPYSWCVMARGTPVTTHPHSCCLRGRRFWFPLETPPNWWPLSLRDRPMVLGLHEQRPQRRADVQSWLLPGSPQKAHDVGLTGVRLVISDATHRASHSEPHHSGGTLPTTETYPSLLKASAAEPLPFFGPVATSKRSHQRCRSRQRWTS